MATPGAIKRKVSGVYETEGSYILRVASESTLPLAPVDDDIFAFASAEETLWRSKAGAWVPVETGGGGGGTPMFNAVEQFYLNLSSAGTLSTTAVVIPGSGWTATKDYDSVTYLADIRFQITVATELGSYSRVQFRVNGAVPAGSTHQIFINGNETEDILLAGQWTMFDVKAGDVLELWAFRDGTTGTVITAASQSRSTVIAVREGAGGEEWPVQTTTVQTFAMSAANSTSSTVALTINQPTFFPAVAYDRVMTVHCGCYIACSVAGLLAQATMQTYGAGAITGTRMGRITSSGTVFLSHSVVIPAGQTCGLDVGISLASGTGTVSSSTDGRFGYAAVVLTPRFLVTQALPLGGDSLLPTFADIAAVKAAFPGGAVTGQQVLTLDNARTWTFVNSRWEAIAYETKTGTIAGGAINYTAADFGFDGMLQCSAECFWATAGDPLYAQGRLNGATSLNVRVFKSSTTSLGAAFSLLLTAAASAQIDYIIRGYVNP